MPLLLLLLPRGVSLCNQDTSSDIYVDSIDIYGDERFPNNDGFDPESCTNVTLVNSHIRYENLSEV